MNYRSEDLFWSKGLHSRQINYKMNFCFGEVSERFKEHAWKACVLETVPWVRIPPSPKMPVPQRAAKGPGQKENKAQEPGGANL